MAAHNPKDAWRRRAAGSEPTRCVTAAPGRVRPGAEPADEPAGLKTDRPADESRRPAGRVEFDSRGNSVWRWDEEDGDSTSLLLKRLENDALQLEPTRPVPTLGNKSGAAKKRNREAEDLEIDESSGRGFNPYDNS